MSSRYRNAEYDRIRRSSSIELDERLSNDAANGKYNGKRSSSSSSRATSLDAFDPASDRMAFVKGAFDEDEKTQAARANEAETQMTLYEGLQKYPKAVAWSMVISTCIIMEGVYSKGQMIDEQADEVFAKATTPHLYRISSASPRFRKNMVFHTAIPEHTA